MTLQLLFSNTLIDHEEADDNAPRSGSRRGNDVEPADVAVVRGRDQPGSILTAHRHAQGEDVVAGIRTPFPLNKNVIKTKKESNSDFLKAYAFRVFIENYSLGLRREIKE